MLAYIMLLYAGAELQLGPVWQTVCAIAIVCKFAEWTRKTAC